MTDKGWTKEDFDGAAFIYYTWAMWLNSMMNKKEMTPFMKEVVIAVLEDRVERFHG